MTSRRDRPPSGRHNMSTRSPLPSPLSNNDSVSGSIRARPKSAAQINQGNSRPYYMPSSGRDRPSTAAPNKLPPNLSGHNLQSNSSTARPPIVNLPPRPKSAIPATLFTPSDVGLRQQEGASGMDGSARSSSRAPPTERSKESEISTREVLRRMREKSDLARRQQASEEIDALGDYNAFSRPRPSTVAPLRSAFLDPETNNFPKSRTRTELMKRIRYASMPHPSYDLDNDGYVSRDDYRLAKRFDFDGNGLLDPEEREIGKRVLTDEFFKRHASDLHNFGAEFVNRPHKENVQKVCTSAHFEHTFGKLMSMERTLKAESSKPLLDCIRNDDDPDFQRHKYYVDKFDATAWNDFTRLPRSSWMTLRPSSPMMASINRPHSSSAAFQDTFHPLSTTNSDSHFGSRKRLLFTRQQNLRAESDMRIESAMQTTAKNNRRVNLITDITKENS